MGWLGSELEHIDGILGGALGIEIPGPGQKITEPCSGIVYNEKIHSNSGSLVQTRKKSNLDPDPGPYPILNNKCA